MYPAKLYALIPGLFQVVSSVFVLVGLALLHWDGSVAKWSFSFKWTFYSSATYPSAFGRASAMKDNAHLIVDPVEPAYRLLNRVLHYNNSHKDFDLQLVKHQDEKNEDDNFLKLLECDLPCFVIENDNSTEHNGHMIRIRGGPTLSEITAGIGWYLRHTAHATSLDLWPAPINITNIDTTLSNQGHWPVPVKRPIIQRRIVPYSYLMNVCTHSYSLVWYTTNDWENFIDWMALNGINVMLALTGQEWIQYKVFRTLGLNDTEIRHWFNGPAYLTWSRGQNFHGNNIGGPLPVSWMKNQWQLQRKVILPRLRELNIIGQLPGFQGNVPIQLQTILNDTNMTPQGATGWMDSLDSWFGKIAKLWMETLLQDFGTDHWYQMDGYFNGGTAPWLQHQKAHDDMWYRRGVAAYRGLNDTDPQAIWSFQGYAFVGWDNTSTAASYLQGFMDSVPSPDRFVILDMSLDASRPEWDKWDTRTVRTNASWIWTVLTNFGGTDGIRGDLRKVNQIPFQALHSSVAASDMANVIGLGATPEGINQNPLYYRFLFEQAFQEKPATNLTDRVLGIVHHRYGLDYDDDSRHHPHVARAWTMLLKSLYYSDRDPKDGTGVAHWAWQGIRNDTSLFYEDQQTPTPMMCQVVEAWDGLLRAGQESRDNEASLLHNKRAFQYDLVNLGREVLAQLSTPAALNFSRALERPILDDEELTGTGRFYIDLLIDIDRLVATDEAFLLGKWLAAARNLGRDTNDCDPPGAWRTDRSLTRCEQLYEWNARCQITSWMPTRANDSRVPGGPLDYASKHWSGLVRDYYARRISKVVQGAKEDATKGESLNWTKMNRIMAQHAHNWTTLDDTEYSTTISGDFLQVSREMFDKYNHYFTQCAKAITDNVHGAPTTLPSADNGKLVAAYRLIDRVLGYTESRTDFELTLLVADDFDLPCDLPCFTIQDGMKGKVNITGGPTISEITAGIGWYLRNVANATSLDNWPPMNITNVDTKSSSWPRPVGAGKSIVRQKNLKYSYLMNVCTHSYSLVWYSPEDWERFIDWMALSGINMMLALTGQEWIQFKVFRKLGLSGTDIRHWFNGPAFLTWSRGQNEYGSNIAGPLPISWMKSQWKLQREVILPRIRELGIVGQLPAFQGNVPIQLKTIYDDANITERGRTGWMDSLDPLFAKVAKVWMSTLIRDFGTDHWYQLDGYFNGGTAPWLTGVRSNETGSTGHDEDWYRRGVAAYRGLNATDPDAIWSFQGFAFVGWETYKQGTFLKGFVDSVPQKERFVIMDMSYDPQEPEWKKWNSSAFFGASYVWTVLHNFGGTEGIKGDLRKVNHIPFDALELPESMKPIGLGATPEGITQNPAYYGLLYEQAFQDQPIPTLTPHVIVKMHQRYGVDPDFDFEPEIAKSWALLMKSLYSTDRSVQDGTGVAHLGAHRISDGSSLFEKDRHTPKGIMCHVYSAWTHLLKAGKLSQQKNMAYHKSKAFQYDLVNLGREVLAQLSTPVALNFSDAIAAPELSAERILLMGDSYQELLLDLDTLVGTEDTFRLETWIKAARMLGKNTNDCHPPDVSQTQKLENQTLCEVFYEWNARCQITTWNPTPANAQKVPTGPIDYAAKHWSGLIREYYAERVSLVQQQAIKDAAQNQPFNETLADLRLAQHAYEWTLLESYSSSSPKEHDKQLYDDYVAVSDRMFQKYKRWFQDPCSSRFKQY